MQISNDVLSLINKLEDIDGQIRNASVSKLSKIKDKEIIEAVAIKLIATFGNVWESSNYQKDNKNDILKDISKIINNYGPDAYNAIINNLDPTIKTGKYSEFGNWSSNASNVLGDLGDVVIPFLIPSLGKSEFTHYSLGFMGSDKAFEILFNELKSSNWSRVQAAARGLGITKNPRANEKLYAAGRAASVGEVAIAIDNAIKQCGGQIPYPKNTSAAHKIGIKGETILAQEQIKIDPRVEIQMESEGKSGCILGMGIIFCVGVGLFWEFINKEFGAALFGLFLMIGAVLTFILTYNKLFKK